MEPQVTVTTQTGHTMATKPVSTAPITATDLPEHFKDAVNPPVVPALTFDDTEVTRESREPNPFETVVAALEVGSTKGKAFTIAGDAKTVLGGKSGKQKSFVNPTLRKVRRQLTEAGDKAPVPVTVRWVVKDNNDGTVRIQIKAINKIIRPNEDDEGAGTKSE